jgi:hypothetical protein
MHGRGSIIDQVNFGLHIEKKQKLLQFVTIFHLLQQGRPPLDYERMRQLFIFVKMQNNPQHHWSDSSVWTMAKCMHNIVSTNTNGCSESKVRFYFC